MNRIKLIAASILAAACALPAAAQEKYPNKTITMVVAYAAGGGADTRARQITKLMSQTLGVTIIIDNKPGAGGNPGTEFISKAKPDGYTIGMGSFAPLAVNHALFKKLPFDPQSDLTPIILIEKGPLMLMVKPDTPFKTVADVVNAAKASPGKLSYGSGGIGGSHHLSGALFEALADIDLIHVPYKSGSAATTDLLGGQTNMMFEQMYTAMPAMKTGKLRALAVTSKKRSPVAPELPTMAEAGFPSFESQNWQGLIGPKGLPADIVATLNAAANKALQDPEQKNRMLEQGNEIGGGSPQAFADLIKAEMPRWGKVVRDAKVTPE